MCLLLVISQHKNQKSPNISKLPAKPILSPSKTGKCQALVEIRYSINLYVTKLILFSLFVYTLLHPPLFTYRHPKCSDTDSFDIYQQMCLQVNCKRIIDTLVILENCSGVCIRTR
ncbi:Hypothetical_protein [Hexamita inflata]|uniref:Hypothetical_protein n=1 Tax=Hexamita inflata TaxID=28002 RepID=A0AA86NJM7_9EUKA|nr:Hypothetical protein HINF_LOCUS7821 [Hexamita inflata]